MKNACSFILALLLLNFIPAVKAQSLATGDIVVAGVNAGTDTVLLIPLVDLPVGTDIKITDVGIISTGSFHATLTGDGFLTWVVTGSPVPKGSLLKLVLGGSDNSPPNELTNLTTSASYTAHVTFPSYTVTDPLLISGDQIIIFQGTSASPSFVFALNNSGAAVDASNWNNVDTPTLTVSRLPAGLTNGVNAIGLPGNTSQQDNVQYIGLTTPTTRAGWLARFVDSASWGGDSAASPGTTVNTITNAGISFALPPTTMSSLVRANATPSKASTVNWTATFGSAVSGLTASNFSRSGTASSGATIGTPTTANGGISWNVPVTTGGSDGTLALTLQNSTGTSPAITNLPFGGESYTMDKTLPTVSISAPSVSSIAAGAGSVTYTVTYADTNFSGSTLNIGNITLNSTGGASATVAVSGSGTTRTVTLSSITGSGTLGISIPSGTASDMAGNTAPAAGPSTTFNVLSTNADLSALSTAAGSIAFSAATTGYAVNVPNATTSTTVTATRAQANATLQVQVNGGGFSALTSGVASTALNLNVGANPIDVKVTAQDGTTIKTYTITVTRAAPAADKIYFTSSSSSDSVADTLSTINPDGTGQTMLVNDTGNFISPDMCAVDSAAGFVFVGDGSSGNKVVRYNLNGTGLTVIYTANASQLPRGVIVNPGHPEALRHHQQHHRRRRSSDPDELRRHGFGRSGDGCDSFPTACLWLHRPSARLPLPRGQFWK